MLKTLKSNSLGLLVLRLLLLYVVYLMCRVVFAVYNYSIIGSIEGADLWSILRGGAIFDSASIFYTNILFIVLSLIPFRFRTKDWYQRFLMIIFVTMNAAALFINISDIVYFEYKLARIASDDLLYFGEPNIVRLLGTFIMEYIVGVIFWLFLVFILYYVGFRKIRYKKQGRVLINDPIFYISQCVILTVSVTFAIIAMRGFSVSKASFPISMSDASLYVKPKYTSLILSNPFCLIRTINKTNVRIPEFYPKDQLSDIFNTTRIASDSISLSVPTEKPNIILIILEGFGSAHINGMGGDTDKNGKSYTPFLDSIIRESLVFKKFYQSGGRSIDALPSIWGSIPSMNENFMSMPQSVGKYKALPSCLVDMDYTTAFFHGATRSSMSFVSFGEMAGVQRFYSREEYEKERGKNDFDGKWGIWDSKFLPFVEEKITTLPQPFFATIFTLSSHHPFIVPQEDNGKYEDGTLPIHKVIRYSDNALRAFFEKASQEDWYKNTLFVITSDHGSGADNEKYLSYPYSHSIPLILHSPTADNIKGERFNTGSHIDIMPTILDVTGYEKPFFSFGRSLISTDTQDSFSVNQIAGNFFITTDSLLYLFNGRETTAIYDYEKDYKHTDNLKNGSENDSDIIKRFKAYIQQYYTTLSSRNYTPE